MHRSRRAVLLIATVLAWAVCASSAHAVGWLPGPTFGDGESFTGIGGVATDGAGVSTVVWVTRDADDTPTVFAQRVSADGGRGPRLTLGAAMPGFSFAQVDGTAAGAVVTWAQPTAVDGDVDVKVAWIGADGAVAATRTAVTAELRGSPVVAAEPDGDVFLAWPAVGDADETVLNARRVAADGTPGPIADLGTIVGGDPSTGTVAAVALSGDGLARVAWVGPASADDETATVRVARFDATGALERASAIAGSLPNGLPQLAGGGGSAVVTWGEPDSGSTTRLRAVPLPSGGALTGTPLTIAASLQTFLPGAGAALAVTPDGTATIAYSAVNTNLQTGQVVSRRLSADGTLSPELVLSAGAGSGQIDVLPFLAPAADGSLIAVWIRATVASGAYVSRAIAADGTLSPQVVDIPLAMNPATLGAGLQFTGLAGSASGNAILGTFVFPAAPGGGGGGAPTAYVTALLDASPPVVSASIPASVQRGADAAFSATATDASGVGSFAWEFGDGSGARGATVTHAYGRAGSYPVTLTVTDRTGNATVVSRTIAVTEPVVPTPPAPPGPGPAARASARLKLTRIARSATAVTVTGTLDRRASGRVTVSWTQRVGRRTIKRTATAKIARGRFSATVKLTGRLKGARTVGTLTVSYAGDADTASARVARSVKAPRAKKKHKR